MKNKTKTYLLISIVFGIWGTIGYKILSVVNPDDSKQPIATLDISFQPKTIIQKDTFSIQLIHRDPFLGTLTSNTIHKKKKAKATKVQNAPEPIITYQGVIKKQNSLNQIFTLSINNQQYLLKKGQTIDDITLVKGNTKEVIIRLNGKLKTISFQ